MLPENRAFLIRGDDGQEYGPVALDELRSWVQENRAGLGSEVRLDAPGEHWYPWQSFPELVALLAEVRVSSPVPGIPGLVIAPLGRRALAFVIDLILNSFLATPILVVLAFAFMPDWCIQFGLASADPRFPVPQLSLHDRIIGSLISDLILALYMAGFHAAHGRTPAKSILRVKVVDEMGKKPNMLKSLLRAVILVVSLGLYGFPFLYALFNPQRRAFHDFVAGTYVVEA